MHNLSVVIEDAMLAALAYLKLMLTRDSEQHLSHSNCLSGGERFIACATPVAVAAIVAVGAVTIEITIIITALPSVVLQAMNCRGILPVLIILAITRKDHSIPITRRELGIPQQPNNRSADVSTFQSVIKRCSMLASMVRISSIG